MIRYKRATVVDGVLSDVGRDHPSELARRTAADSVPAFHNGSRRFVGHSHRNHVQHTFPFLVHTCHARLDAQGIYLSILLLAP